MATESSSTGRSKSTSTSVTHRRWINFLFLLLLAAEAYHLGLLQEGKLVAGKEGKDEAKRETGLERPRHDDVGGIAQVNATKLLDLHGAWPREMSAHIVYAATKVHLEGAFASARSILENTKTPEAVVLHFFRLRSDSDIDSYYEVSDEDFIDTRTFFTC